ncbi:hypothetical protein NQT69_13460 [Pseudoalteromonas shioyasakiensis]|uniref:hypothetical protein n=1 Tax=Pseudoalteromonas shioyasakiensis TaxID=1190813 RepID=UPI0021197534|nr:hypothetical protein [Pseudoalteromonas shioyasakiensis]MCQ8879014.1 hypothetical protein [Pseudoalteromonas shioyasakiensis]
MGVHLKTIAMVCITSIALAGCELTDNTVQQEVVAAKPKPVAKPNEGLPNPKPRPKTDPMYPPAQVIIGWHAKACGGFKITENNTQFVGAKEIQQYFDFSCKNNVLAPDAVLTKLLKLDQAYYWPDDIKQYWWLQKQQIKQQINAKKEQEALHDKMQETLSSLATIEQQLLLREETKEQ